MSEFPPNENMSDEITVDTTGTLYRTNGDPDTVCVVH